MQSLALVPELNLRKYSLDRVVVGTVFDVPDGNKVELAVHGQDVFALVDL